jgi:hypothetical protein
MIEQEKIVPAGNQELKNKFLIFDLVKNHFSLTENSLELFKFRLFNEPLIAEEYKAIIGNSPDMRKRISITGEFAENFDAGWRMFKNQFRHFVADNKVSYENFRSNKVIVKKNELKLKKALIGYYCAHKSAYGQDLLFNSYNTNATQEQIEARLTEILNKIGTKKIPNSGLEIVISLNFADWFLCSAGEKWSSCISLDSGYERAFWSGLPGLIGDKNRAMVYITDGKKKNYHGIITDRFISRSWVVLVRSKEQETKNETCFTMVREYPSSIGLKSIAEKLFGIKLYGYDYEEEDSLREFVGRYYIELLWHKVKNIEFFNSIYFDNLNIKIAHKNVAEHNKSGSYGQYINGAGNNAFIRKPNGDIRLTDKGFYYDGGLSRLIDEKVWKENSKKRKMKCIAEFFGDEEEEFRFDEDDGYGDGEDEEGDEDF